MAVADGATILWIEIAIRVLIAAYIGVAAWLTVRNWSVLAQILIVTLIAATHVAGLTGQVFLAYFFVLFYPVFLTVLHLSIAFAVLRGPWQRVAGAGMIVVLADFVSREGMQALAMALAPVQPS